MKIFYNHVFKQFICFTAVGAIGTLFHYAVLISLVQFIQLRPIIGSTAGFSVGAVVNYILNYYVTFRSNSSHWAAMPKFYLVALVGLGINTAFMYMLNEWLMIHYLIAQVISTGAVLVSNFVCNKLWTFKEASHVTDRLPSA